MGYSVKWVAENLGITRDMLRYYEKEKLLPIVETRNPTNKYRDYSEEDIERIWGIKLLISIGFTAKEIRAFANESDFSFYDAISQKVEQLEQQYNQMQIALGFAKTIKMTGRIPNTSKVGIMRFDDFIQYTRENWNAFSDPQGKKYMQVAETFLSKPVEAWSDDDLGRMMEIFGDIDPEQMEYIQTLSGYYRVIADMEPLGYENEVVQGVVKCLYNFVSQNIEPQYKEQFSTLRFVENSISTFVDSGLAKLNERIYGKDGCVFIAKALAYHIGYDPEEL